MFVLQHQVKIRTDVMVCESRDVMVFCFVFLLINVYHGDVINTGVGHNVPVFCCTTAGTI